MCLSAQGTVRKIKGGEVTVNVRGMDKVYLSPIKVKKGDKVVIALGVIVENRTAGGTPSVSGSSRSPIKDLSKG